MQKGLLNSAERACSNKSFSRHGAGSQREEAAAAWQQQQPGSLAPWQSELEFASLANPWRSHFKCKSAASGKKLPGKRWLECHNNCGWNKFAVKSRPNRPNDRRTHKTRCRTARVRDRCQVTKRGKLWSSYEAARSQLLTEVKAKTAGQAVQRRGGAGEVGSGAGITI